MAIASYGAQKHIQYFYWSLANTPATRCGVAAVVYSDNANFIQRLWRYNLWQTRPNAGTDSAKAVHQSTRGKPWTDSDDGDEDGMQVRVEIYEKLRETQRKRLHKIANRVQGRD